MAGRVAGGTGEGALGRAERAFLYHRMQLPSPLAPAQQSTEELHVPSEVSGPFAELGLQDTSTQHKVGMGQPP